MSRELLSRRLGVEGANVVVLGLAVTGRVAARILADAGANVLASDSGSPSLDGLDDVDVETGGHDRARGALERADFVLPSPGIPPRADVLADAVSRGVRVVSELDLAQRLTDAKVVGITGTKGKTTVCRLVERMLRGSGADTYACGNNEVPFLEAVVEHPNADAFIVEASSFRLYFAETFHPHAAVVTNLAPDHLDWHPSMDDYRAAKARIAMNQTNEDVFVFPDDQPELAVFARDGGPLRVPFGARHVPGAWIEGDEVVVALSGDPVRVSGVAALAQRGPHFALDAAAAAAAAAAAGAGARAIEQGLAGFVPDRHRLEFVGERAGVRFYDDSMATNPFAALAAIRAFDGCVVLIAGGRKKVPDLSALAAEAGRLRSVVAIGEAADDVAAAFADTKVAVSPAASMREAVERAIAGAQEGDVVLLAPACASQDAYTNYAERGEDFAETCRLLGVGM